MDELKVKFDLDFRFKNVKGETEKEAVFPAYEMLAEFLTRQASDSREKRARLFNWGMKLMENHHLILTKSEIDQILDSISGTNMSNLYFVQIEQVADAAKEEYDRLRKEKKSEA